MTPQQERKKNLLFVVLAGIFITNALMAEMIGVKIFSAEKTVGLSPAHMNIRRFFNAVTVESIFIRIFAQARLGGSGTETAWPSPKRTGIYSRANSATVRLVSTHEIRR